MAAALQPPHQAAPRSRSKSASGREQLEKIQKHLPPHVSENITKVTKIVDKLSGHEPRTSTGTYTGAAPPTSYQEYHQQNSMNGDYTYGGSSQCNSQLPYDQQHLYGTSLQHHSYGNSHIVPNPHYQSNQHLQPPPPSASYGQQPPPFQANEPPDMHTYSASTSYHHVPSPNPGPPAMSGGASSATMHSSSGKPDGKSTTSAKLASTAEKLLVKQALKSRNKKKKKHGGMGFGNFGEEDGENGEGGEGEHGDYGGEGGEDGEGDWNGDLAGDIGENVSGDDVGGGDGGSGMSEVLGAIFGG